MSAALAASVREVVPRDIAKWFARALGVSVRTGKRYAAHPELFPRSRTEQLLIALEREERELEARREERSKAREAVKREIRAQLGMDGAGLDLPSNRDGGRLDRGADGEVWAVLPHAGRAAVKPGAAPTAAKRKSPRVKVDTND